jgi:L-ribulose-5-phosphate 4-epimerase
MAYEQLKQDVYDANMALVKAGLVVLTWGNASGADRAAGLMAIKPSGVSYDVLKPSDIVVLSLKSGEVIDGTARPSSDTATHLHLYQQFDTINGIAHTHSTCGTTFAQAQQPIPCLGTTHADNFYGDIPVTRPMTRQEVEIDYELNTGKVIVEHFRTNKIEALQIPGVLVASHAPFAWGATPAKAVENAIVLEFTAEMALLGMTLSSKNEAIPKYLLDKHFLRKHGPRAYYGQP